MKPGKSAASFALPDDVPFRFLYVAEHEANRATPRATPPSGTEARCKRPPSFFRPSPIERA